MKPVPETPGELRKLAAHSHTSMEERARIGCALLVADRLAALESTLSRVLDVLVKHGDARGEIRELKESLDNWAEAVADVAAGRAEVKRGH